MSPRLATYVEEGDVRLMDHSTVANWQMDRLEVFFEGSWSQVCAREFDGPDADVACRHLGFGAGTVGPNEVGVMQQETKGHSCSQRLQSRRLAATAQSRACWSAVRCAGGCRHLSPGLL